MFENIGTFFKKIMKTEPKQLASKDAAKERLHLVLMQDRANVSVDFLELMKQEIIDVIKKYIEIDEKSIDVRLTNQANDDGTTGAPALYANIPIVNIKNDSKSENVKENETSIMSENDEQVQDKTVSKENIENKEETVNNEKQEEISIENEEVKKEEVVEAEKIENEKSESIQLIKENDDEIDDVPTFDELLKQSEEENKENKEEEDKAKIKKSTNTNKNKKKTNEK